MTSITAHSEADFGCLRAWNYPAWRSNGTNIQATYGTDDIIISFSAYDQANECWPDRSQFVPLQMESVVSAEETAFFLSRRSKKKGTTLFDKLQLTRLKSLLVFLIGYTACLYLFALTLDFTFPFVVGFLLALMLQPLVRFLKEKLRLRSGFASILVTLLSFFVLFELMVLLDYWLVTEITTLVVRLSSIDTMKIVGPLNGLMGHLGIYVDRIDSEFIRQNQEQLIKFLQTGAGILTSVLNTIPWTLASLPAILTTFIAMIFSTYFFAKDMPMIKRYVASFLPQTTVINIRSASRHSLAMSGKLPAPLLLTYLITSLQILLVSFLLGMPYPLAPSPIADIAGVLPILGPGAVYIPLAVISLIQGDYSTAVAPIAAQLPISTIRQMIQSKIVSAFIDIHPLSMLAAIYFALVAGRVGILIYMTLLSVLYQVLCKISILPWLSVSDSDLDKQDKRLIPSTQKDNTVQPEPPADS